MSHIAILVKTESGDEYLDVFEVELTARNIYNKIKSMIGKNEIYYISDIEIACFDKTINLNQIKYNVLEIIERMRD